MFKLICGWSPLLCSPDITHLLNIPRPSPFFTALLLCIIVSANWRMGWPGNEATKLLPSSHCLS